MECVQCARTPPGVERDNFFEGVGLLPQPDFAQCHVQSPVQIESTPSGVGLWHLFGTSAFSLPLGNFACLSCLCMQPGRDCKRTCLGHPARGPLHEIERYVCAAKRDGLLGAECPWVSVHGTSARSLPRLQISRVGKVRHACAVARCSQSMCTVRIADRGRMGLWRTLAVGLSATLEWGGHIHRAPD